MAGELAVQYRGMDSSKLDLARPSQQSRVHLLLCSDPENQGMYALPKGVSVCIVPGHSTAFTGSASLTLPPTKRA